MHGTLLSKIVSPWLHGMRLTAAILPHYGVLGLLWCIAFCLRCLLLAGGAARIKPTPLSLINTVESQTTLKNNRNLTEDRLTSQCVVSVKLLIFVVTMFGVLLRQSPIRKRCSYFF